MTGVVLRCPHCGTTQEVEGTCDACQEASVQYFCLNHTPGVWLESESCPQCGAQFGDSPPIEETPTVEKREVAPPISSDRSRASRRPWDTEVAEVRRPYEERAASDPFRILLGALAAAARARSERVRGEGFEGRAPVPRRGGCCVGQVLMLVLLLGAFFLIAPMFLGALLGLR